MKFFLAAILLTAPFLFAETPAEHNAQGDRVWKITSYIRGTNSQIRNQLHGEIARLLAAKAEAAESLARAQVSLQKDSDSFLDNFNPYQKALAQQSDAVEKLAKARLTHDSRAVITETGRLHRAKRDLIKIRSSAKTQNDLVAQDFQRVTTAEHEVARLDEALKKAEAWQADLQDAIRNTFALAWPLRIGNVGLVGKITPQKVDDAGRLWAVYDASEWHDKKETAEGIATFATTHHSVLLCLTGINPGDFKPGIDVVFDRNVEITRSDYADGDFIYYAKLKPADVNELFDAVDNR